MQRKQKLNNIFCTIIATTYNIATLMFIIYPCITEDDTKTSKWNMYTTAFMFSFLGVMFLAYGIGMNLSLRSYFPHFYISFRFFLWTACFCLSMPLFLRFVIDAARQLSPPFRNWWDHGTSHFYITNTGFLILTTYLPIIT